MNHIYLQVQREELKSDNIINIKDNIKGNLNKLKDQQKYCNSKKIILPFYKGLNSFLLNLRLDKISMKSKAAKQLKKNQIVRKVYIIKGLSWRKILKLKVGKNFTVPFC